MIIPFPFEDGVCLIPGIPYIAVWRDEETGVVTGLAEIINKNDGNHHPTPISLEAAGQYLGGN